MSIPTQFSLSKVRIKCITHHKMRGQKEYFYYAIFFLYAFILANVILEKKVGISKFAWKVDLLEHRSK